MKRSVGLGAILLLLVAATGCDDVIGVRGSGNTITESRDVIGFNQIVLLGSGVVVVDVDGTESLVIEAEDNIMPLLTTEVNNGTLELGAESSIRPTEDVRYIISAALLDGVAIEGSGEITPTNVESASFSAGIDGSGTITPSGSVALLSVDISGSGEFAGAELEARDAEVSMSGSGDAVVNATEMLEVDISGSGSVEYIGNPAVSTSISGSGSVSQR